MYNQRQYSEPLRGKSVNRKSSAHFLQSVFTFITLVFQMKVDECVSTGGQVVHMLYVLPFRFLLKALIT